MKNTKIEDAATESRKEKRRKLRTEFEKKCLKAYPFDFDFYKVDNYFIVKDHLKPFCRNGNSHQRLKPQLFFSGSRVKVKYSIRIDGETLYFSFHRLVALLGVPVPERYSDLEIDELQTHHIDRNTLNNYSSNLMWLSDADHRLIHKLINRFPNLNLDRMSRQEIYDLLDELHTEPERKEVQNNEHTHN